MVQLKILLTLLNNTIMINHTTIICPPDQFDEQFKKFISSNRVGAVEIQHFEHVHYILWKSSIMFDEDDF